MAWRRPLGNSPSGGQAEQGQVKFAPAEPSSCTRTTQLSWSCSPRADANKLLAKDVRELSDKPSFHAPALPPLLPQAELQRAPLARPCCPGGRSGAHGTVLLASSRETASTEPARPCSYRQTSQTRPMQPLPGNGTGLGSSHQLQQGKEECFLEGVVEWSSLGK